MGWLEMPYRPLKKEYKIGVVLTGVTNPYIQTGRQIDFSEGADRFTEALRLYHQGIIEKILITGGSGLLLDQSYRESPQLGKLAAILGVMPGDLILESKSRNTYENAKFSMPILNEISPHMEIVLITSAFHMTRSVACFEKQDLKVVPYPVDFRSSKVILDYNMWIPNAGAIGTWSTLIKELVGMIFYRIAGYT